MDEEWGTSHLTWVSPLQMAEMGRKIASDAQAANGHRAYTDPSAAGVRGRMPRLQPDNNWKMPHSFT